MKKYNYDKEVDILTIYKDAKVKHSAAFGDFIVDFDSNELVVGLEVLEASEHFGKLDLLQNANMNVIYKQNSIYINLSLMLNGKEKDITIPLIS